MGKQELRRTSELHKRKVVIWFTALLVALFAIVAMACVYLVCGTDLSTLNPWLRNENTVLREAEEDLRTAKHFIRLNELYNSYLHGDAEQARRSLNESIVILEAPNTGLTAVDQAQGLWMTYCRLYVLESRLGDETEASNCLEKARYWYVRKLELGGISATDAAHRAEEVDPEDWVRVVDRWNESRRNAAPNHFQSLKRQIQDLDGELKARTANDARAKTSDDGKPRR